MVALIYVNNTRNCKDIARKIVNKLENTEIVNFDKTKIEK